jgi:hypothetical protein
MNDTTEKKCDEVKLDDLEPGDRKEDFSPVDWCLAAGCGCGGCMDPTGCSNALGQGCLGLLDVCLAHLGCGVIAIGLVVFAIIRLIMFIAGT